MQVDLCTILVGISRPACSITCTVHCILPFPPLSHSQAVKLRDRSLALNGLQSAHYMSHLVSPHNALLFITRQEQKGRRRVGWVGGWQEDGMHMWGGLERVSSCEEDTSPQGERWGEGGRDQDKDLAGNKTTER